MVRPLAISAPGSLMLLGEHAVLDDRPCVVAAIEKRIRVSIIPRNDGLVTITSSLGEYEGDRDDLPDHPSFRFVIAALRHQARVLPGGCDASILADMPPTIGFGTSAAVTVAMTGALHMADKGSWSLSDVLRDARTVIQRVQGRGSGADVAASVFGGVVHYRMNDDHAEIIQTDSKPLTALYCGYKTPTPEVIARVDLAWSGKIAERDQLYTRIGETAGLGRAALLEHDDNRFGQILNAGHTLMQQLGVSTRELDQCAEQLRSVKSITGAKISGSGMGDCVIGWGSMEAEAAPFDQYHVMTAPEGIRIE